MTRERCGAVRRIRAPLALREVKLLRAGDRVLLSGIVFAARDAAHERLSRLMAAGRPLPFPLKGQVIYYMGPTPAGPGRVIGSAGPTTSSRMDAYTPRLLEAGLKGMIGKGARSPAVREAMLRHQAVYFAAVGGAAALLAGSIRSVRAVAWEDLGPEAVLRLEVRDLPLVVVNDILGQDLYQQGVRRYCRRSRKKPD